MRFATGISETCQVIEQFCTDQENGKHNFEVMERNKKNIKPRLKYFDESYELSHEHRRE